MSELTDRAKARAEFYETRLHDKVLTPFHETMLELGILVSSKPGREHAVTEFVGMEMALPGVIANMILGFCLTVADAHPQATKRLCDSFMQSLNKHITEGRSRVASGLEPEAMDVTHLRHGKRVPYDFHNDLRADSK